MHAVKGGSEVGYIPLMPADAGIQALRQRPEELGPRFRGDERIKIANAPPPLLFSGVGFAVS